VQRTIAHVDAPPNHMVPIVLAFSTSASFVSAAWLQEELGLKLEPAKGPVDVLVIDSVQKPSEN
jgi:uncharacterized protein (TIGR03435 family)